MKITPSVPTEVEPNPRLPTALPHTAHLVKGSQALDTGTEVTCGQQQLDCLIQLHRLLLVLAHIKLEQKVRRQLIRDLYLKALRGRFITSTSFPSASKALALTPARARAKSEPVAGLAICAILLY